MKIADHINVVRIDRDKTYRVEIDGEEFPYYLHAEAPVSMEVASRRHPTDPARTDMPLVTLRIPANRVTVDDDIRNASEVAHTDAIAQPVSNG